ncbi:hypothetical protein COT95_02800 [Candidatus Falkowbacteria bacterium CG10_big_fil_rev_8_21_14_0_10_37_6]|uniref:Uncharacterized protein n=1 Tax=Candidatus Falkowbacteria bacterium CG10_big_fil_rev_8_21_14_0_10_37_6 TaxID=1974563 RepID=A0A2H0V8J7_9BACT|nr:MAG: hypothetical protein COT95_02800 [Candidatus Falkowbacteria bacterium CG10_big_fil_rev_8_21_14_0_10_37_6]
MHKKSAIESIALKRKNYPYFYFVLISYCRTAQQVHGSVSSVLQAQKFKKSSINFFVASLKAHDSFFSVIVFSYPP